MGQQPFDKFAANDKVNNLLLSFVEMISSFRAANDLRLTPLLPGLILLLTLGCGVEGQQAAPQEPTMSAVSEPSARVYQPTDIPDLVAQHPPTLNIDPTSTPASSPTLAPASTVKTVPTVTPSPTPAPTPAPSATPTPTTMPTPAPTAAPTEEVREPCKGELTDETAQASSVTPTVPFEYDLYPQLNLTGLLLEAALRMQDEAAAQQLGKKWEPSREDDPIQVDIAVCLPAEDTAPYVSAWLSEHGVKHSAVSFPNSTSIISASVRPSLLGRLSLLDGVRDVAPLGSLTPRGRGAPPTRVLL